MKKMPTVYVVDYIDHRPTMTDKVDPKNQWVLDGLGEASVKYDGTACAVIDGKFYTRFDCKKGKTPPKNSIPCQPSADPVTGHWPHWTPVLASEPAHKHFITAYTNTVVDTSVDQTFEAVGPHFNGNKQKLDYDQLVVHGADIVDELSYTPITKEILRDYLENHHIEGIVFLNKNTGQRAKIRKKDFKLKW